MEMITAPPIHAISYFQNKIDNPSISRLDVWNENRNILFSLAKNYPDDRGVQRAVDIWTQNLKESIDDPKYGDELLASLICAHHKVHGRTPHFFFKHLFSDNGVVVYEGCILRKDMCGHKKWSKVKKMRFDGWTHEFKINNEQIGYPISVI